MVDKNKLTPSDVSVMKPEIKMKLNTKSIKYSLKFIIKGERNTGKSSLFNRLQGLQFKEQYTPTPEIQISHINWDYKNTDDIVDVEIWDIVDVATTSSALTLKTTTKQQLQQQQLNQNNNIDNNGIDQDKIEESFYEDEGEQSFDPKLLMSSLNSLKNSGGKTGGSFKIGGLDSKTINVYKGVNAVIFMIDPSKRWTFKYVEKEFDKVPLDKHILLISNFRDKNPIGIGSANTVTSISSNSYNNGGGHSSKESQIVTYGDIQSLINSRDNNTVTHIEASMLNAYGLSNIVRFFNIPFLEAQKQSLLQQLQRNDLELLSSKEELSLMIKESNYNNFIKRATSSQPQQPPPPQQQPQVATPPSPPLQPIAQQHQQPSPPQVAHQILYPSSPPTQTNSGTSSFFSRLFSKDPTPTTQSAAILLQQQQAQQQAQLLLQQQSQSQSQPSPSQQHKKVVLPTMPKVLSNIDEFVAGTNDDDDFYSEKTSKIAFIKNIIPTGKQQTPADKFGNDSDDDDNPWVSKEEDDFYSTKTPTTQHKKQTSTTTTTKSKAETTTPTTSKSQTTTPTTSNKQTSPKITPKSPTPIVAATITSKVEKAFTEFNPFGESKVDFIDDEESDDDYNPTASKSKPVKFNSDESDDDDFNPLVAKDMDYDDIPTTISKSTSKPTTPKTTSPKLTSATTMSTSPKTISPKLTSTSTTSATTISTSPKTISPKPLSSPKTTTTSFSTSPKPIVKKQQTPPPQIKQQHKFNSDDEDDEKVIDYDDIVDDIKTNSPKITTSKKQQPKQPIKFIESDSEDDKSNSIVTKDDDYEDFF